MASSDRFARAELKLFCKARSRVLGIGLELQGTCRASSLAAGFSRASLGRVLLSSPRKFDQSINRNLAAGVATPGAAAGARSRVDGDHQRRRRNRSDRSLIL